MDLVAAEDVEVFFLGTFKFGRSYSLIKCHRRIDSLTSNQICNLFKNYHTTIRFDFGLIDFDVEHRREIFFPMF